MTKSEILIAEIQDELKDAAKELENARELQEAAVDAVLAGDFITGVLRAEAVGRFIKSAKKDEEKAAKLLVQLIPQMHSDGFADEIIFGVVETLIAEFLGA